MPPHLKLMLSVVALALCCAVFFLTDLEGAARWVALALGPIMVFSIWVFPEARAEDVRKHAAEKRRS